VLSPGTSNIVARADGVTGSSTLTAIYVPVKSVAVSPSSATVQAKKTTTFTAQALDSIGVPIAGERLGNRTILWSISDTTKAVINASGLVTTRAEGVVEIRSIVDGVMGKSLLTVTRPAPVRIDLTPKARNLAVGQSVQLTATALDSLNSALPGLSFGWTTSSVANLTISQTGLATAVAWGIPSVAASTEGVTGTTTVVVSDTLWRKVATLPSALAGQQLLRPAYDYQTGTVYLARKNFDGSIWKRDAFNNWTTLTIPQNTFGACVGIFFDPPTQDLIVAACGGDVWRVGTVDGRITAATGLGVFDDEYATYWDPVLQQMQALSQSPGYSFGGYFGRCDFDNGAPQVPSTRVAAAFAWDPSTRTRVQAALGARCWTYRRTSGGSLYPGLQSWANYSLYLWDNGVPSTLVSRPDVDLGWVQRSASMPEIRGDFFELAICSTAAGRSIWRMGAKSRTLDRYANGSGDFTVRALFAAPQSETPLATGQNVHLMCDGSRNQLWVVESSQEGGGIWRYLGTP
jgi:hypothetical protein